jgi:hypothetical protein
MVENEGRLTVFFDLASLPPRYHLDSPYVEPQILLFGTSKFEDLSSETPLWVPGARGSKEDPKRRKRDIIKVTLRSIVENNQLVYTIHI